MNGGDLTGSLTCVKTGDLLQKDTVWATIREEVQRDYQSEPLLSATMFSTVLAHDTIEESLAFILAKKLENAVLPAPKLAQLFQETLKRDEVSEDFVADLVATYDRDPACRRYSSCFLYYKGFHAIQTHRVAHALYNQGRTSLALFLQSRSSEAFHVDIHPAATIARGMMLDHATGVVIGETAVVGEGCTLLHGVTLGGSGKDHGDRHPKIGKHVLLGAGCSVLGNIRVGDRAKLGAGSIVLKPIPSGATAVGAPAKIVGRVVEENPAGRGWVDAGVTECVWSELTRHAGPTPKNTISYPSFKKLLAHSSVDEAAIGELFFELDGNLDGFITEKEFRDNFDKCSDRLCEAMCESSLQCPERRTSIKRHVVGTMHQITPTSPMSPAHRALESPE